MTLTNCYIDMQEMLEHAGITDRNDDSTLEAAVTAACRAIDDHCGRIFYDSGAVSARAFRPVDWVTVPVWDFHTTTGLVVKMDDDDDGAYETTISSTDYELHEAPGPMHVARPYGLVRLVSGDLFPLGNYRRLSVQVTAQWGWSAVPAVISQASKIVALDLWKRKDAPFGVTGTVDFGGIRIGRDVLAGVSTLLAPYRRTEYTHGLA